MWHITKAHDKKALPKIEITKTGARLSSAMMIQDQSNNFEATVPLFRHHKTRIAQPQTTKNIQGESDEAKVNPQKTFSFEGNQPHLKRPSLISSTADKNLHTLLSQTMSKSLGRQSACGGSERSHVHSSIMRNNLMSQNQDIDGAVSGSQQNSKSAHRESNRFKISPLEDDNLDPSMATILRLKMGIP